MKERPILFSGPMVRAILDGRKTQTRRIVKPKPRGSFRVDYDIRADPNPFFVVGDSVLRCPYGEFGDRLWVRETFAAVPCASGCEKYPVGFNPHVASIRQPDAPEYGWRYRATWDKSHASGWKPSIHMPRLASRLMLEITDVRVERLQEIDEIDAIAEGLEVHEFTDAYGTEQRAFSFGDYLSDNGIGTYDYSAVSVFEELWESINGPDSWDANPWVWVVEFKKTEATE